MKQYFEVQGEPVAFSDGSPPVQNPLHRPKVRYTKALLCLALFAAGIVAICLVELPVSGVLLASLWTLAFALLFSKRALVWLVLLYQSKAPEHVRLRCVFEPSCSEYMILSLKKYGVIRGLYRGVRRLLRCHSPNGGRDDP